MLSLIHSSAINHSYGSVIVVLIIGKLKGSIKDLQSDLQLTVIIQGITCKG